MVRKRKGWPVERATTPETKAEFTRTVETNDDNAFAKSSSPLRLPIEIPLKRMTRANIATETATCPTLNATRYIGKRPRRFVSGSRKYNSDIRVAMLDTTKPAEGPNVRQAATHNAILAETWLLKAGIKLEKASDIIIENKKIREASTASLLILK